MPHRIKRHSLAAKTKIFADSSLQREIKPARSSAVPFHLGRPPPSRLDPGPQQAGDTWPLTFPAQSYLHVFVTLMSSA